jgi:hypothetical protein
MPMKSAEEVRRQLWAASMDTDVGLWWIADDVVEYLGISGPDMLPAALELLAPLFERGVVRLVAPTGPEEWRELELSPAAALERIRADWTALGRRPRSDDPTVLITATPHGRTVFHATETGASVDPGPSM